MADLGPYTLYDKVSQSPFGLLTDWDEQLVSFQ